MSKKRDQRTIEEMSVDLLKRIHEKQIIFEKPLPRGAPDYLERTIDKDLLWREYELHIDLYKHYLRIVAAFNVFFYGVTGAVISYSLNAGNPQVRWALVFPMVMSIFSQLSSSIHGIRSKRWKERLTASPMLLVSIVQKSTLLP